MDTDSHTAPTAHKDNPLARFIAFWLERRYIGRFLRPELLLLALIGLTGVRAAANGHPLAGIATAATAASALVWLLAAPGPLKCSAGHFTASVWFAAVMLFLWIPLWKHWAGGAPGHLAAWLTGWAAAALTGAAHDRVAGPILIGAKARKLLSAGYPLTVPGLFLHTHRGRWWCAAETTMPITLTLNNGTRKHLVPGDRHIWPRSARHLAPDMAKMMSHNRPPPPRNQNGATPH